MKHERRKRSKQYEDRGEEQKKFSLASFGVWTAMRNDSACAFLLVIDA